MKFRDRSLLVAMVVSAALHAAMMVCVRAGIADQVLGLGFERQAYVAPHVDAPPVIQPNAPPPPIPIPQPPEPVDLLDQLGEADGIGTAIKSVAGEELAVFRAGRQDQPEMSLDPIGEGGTNEQMSPPTPPAPVAPVAAVQPAVPFGVATERPLVMPRVHVPTPDQGSEPVRMAMAATREWATDSPTTEAQPSPPPQPPSQATSTAPPAQVPGDPSPEGDSNIDGFTRTEDVVAEMRAGQVTARTGREFRFPAPRLGHAGVFEVGRVRDRLVLEISINREGNVEHVQITTSSGSDYVDHAYRTAAYKGWFQPRPERAGKAGETFEFTVRFVS